MNILNHRFRGEQHGIKHTKSILNSPNIEQESHLMRARNQHKNANITRLKFATVSVRKYILRIKTEIPTDIVNQLAIATKHSEGIKMTDGSEMVTRWKAFATLTWH